MTKYQPAVPTVRKVLLKLESINATITKCSPDSHLTVVTATVQRGDSLITKTRVSKND